MTTSTYYRPAVYLFEDRASTKGHLLALSESGLRGPLGKLISTSDSRHLPFVFCPGTQPPRVLRNVSRLAPCSALRGTRDQSQARVAPQVPHVDANAILRDCQGVRPHRQ